MANNPILTADRFFFKMFSDGSTTDMSVDGTTPVDYKVTNDGDQGTVVITRLNFTIVDNGISYTNFMGIASPLTNGVEIKSFDVNDNLLVDWTDGHNIKATEDLGLLSGTDSIIQAAAGDDSVPIRWTIGRSGASLLLEAGDYMRIRIQDNLSTLVKFECMAQGYYL